MELMIAMYPTVNWDTRISHGKKIQQTPVKKILQHDLIRKVTVMNTN